MARFDLHALEEEERYYRIILALVALLLGGVAIGIMTAALPPPGASAGPGAGAFNASGLLLGRGTSFPYPFTVQNLMWLMFFFGLGELWVRFYRAKREQAQLRENALPSNDPTVLFERGKPPLASIYQWATADANASSYILQRLVVRVVQQYQISGSVDQSSQLLSSSLDLMQHELELKYNMLRYLVWLIPTLGFIGTVIGIALGLAQAAEMPDMTAGADIRAWFAGMTVELGIAFNTTLMALGLSAILVFLMHICQGREESTLNSAGQYCLDHLVNRLMPA